MSKVYTLYELIKSLTPAEKSGFKKKHKPKPGDTPSYYFELFQILDGTKKYDEEKIKHKIRERIKYKTFVLPNTLNNLHKLIRLYLRKHHQQGSALIELYEMLTDIQILLDKNLMDQAWDTIRKAKRKAKEFHHDIILLKLLVLEKQFIRQHEKQHSDKLMANNHEESEKYLEQFTISLDLFKFYDKIFLLTRNKDLKVDANKIVKELINQLPIIPPTSFDNKMLYHQAYSLYYKHIDDKNGNLKYSASHLFTLIQYFDENPHLIDEYTNRYIYIINNYLNAFTLLKRFNEFPIYLKKLEDIPKKTKKRENVGYKLFEVKSYLSLLYYISTEKFKEGLNIIPEVEEGLKKYKEKISLLHQISINHNIGLIYFHNKLFDKASFYLAYLADEKQEVRQDIKLFCKLQLAVIAYEEGQDSSLESITRSITRKKEYDGYYIKNVAKTLQKAFGALKKKEKSLFQELKETLEKRNDYEHGKDQILIWLKKKI